MQSPSLVIDNCTFAGGLHGHIIISGERIHSIVPGPWRGLGLKCIDAGGRMVMPGAIDMHVHFREPGLTHKATIGSESRAAVHGGVTSFIDMPNTLPQTTSEQLVNEKKEIAARTSAANYGFFVGATRQNLTMIQNMDFRNIAGIKLFMGSSTGGMLLNTEHELSQLFETTPKGVLVAVHAEDDEIIAENRRRITALYPQGVPVEQHTCIRSSEACIRATERAMNLASRYGTRLHIAHISTRQELSLFSAGPISDKQFTCEVSPHHLLWCTDNYNTRGTRIKMNPAVKTAADREALHRGLMDGKIDIVATDHAPHLLSEKEGDALTATSGAPMVQFSLPVMLDMFPIDTVIRTMCQNPATLLRINGRGTLTPGSYADIVAVEQITARTITDADVLSICGWTPLQDSLGICPYTTRHQVQTLCINGGHGPCALQFSPYQKANWA